MVTSLCSKWAVGAIRGGTFRRILATCGTVGTRSRAIRGSTSDDRVGCSASDGRCAPARPALYVSKRLLPFLPCALASADCMGPLDYCASCERAAPDAPETIDDQRRCTGCRHRRSTAARAGAHPYVGGVVGPIISTAHTNDSHRTRKAFLSVRLRTLLLPAVCAHFRNHWGMSNSTMSGTCEGTILPATPKPATIQGPTSCPKVAIIFKCWLRCGS